MARMFCSFCGSNTHVIRTCPRTAGGQSRRRMMRCSFCGKKDHNIRACPKTNGGNARRAWAPHKIKADYLID